MVDISVIMGSESDRSIANRATSVLEKNKYTYEVMVLSAHRNPEELDSYISSTDAKVFIAIAGLSAALPLSLIHI